MLADAFSEFISASSLLEASYRDLQQEVAHLGLELAERNAALSSSLAENDRMRAALQQMIDSMPCGVLVLDTAETIVMINPESRRLLDLGTAQVRLPGSPGHPDHARTGPRTRRRGGRLLAGHFIPG